METESLLKVEQLAIKNTKFSNKAIFVTSPAPCSPACLSASASLLRLRQATSFIWSIPSDLPDGRHYVWRGDHSNRVWGGICLRGIRSTTRTPLCARN